MGAYISKSDILEILPEEVLIQLTDDERVGAVNDARCNAAIDKAEGEVNGYLATRYPTPLSPVPVAVKKFTADIAVYNLFSRTDTVPQDRETRYDNAIKFLVNVSKGLVSLGIVEPKPSNPVGGVDFSGNGRQFTRAKLEGF